MTQTMPRRIAPTFVLYGWALLLEDSNSCPCGEPGPTYFITDGVTKHHNRGMECVEAWCSTHQPARWEKVW